MHRILSLMIVIGLACCLVAGTVCADRLILTPKGDTLSTGGIKAEYAARPDSDDGQIYWVNLGVSRIELEGARFQNFGGDTLDVVSAQVSVLPETTFTPAVAIGARDIANDTEGQSLPYSEEALYLSVSKGVPVTGGVPLLFQDVRMHGGIGTGSLSGVFFGIEGKLAPLGVGVQAEYDTDDFNYAATYSIIPALKLKVSSIKGDVYYGATLSTAF
jgi:hypothetical protein